MVNDRPRLGFIKYCRGYFLNRRKRREEKRKNSCRECKNLLVYCKCKTSKKISRNDIEFRRKAKMCGLISDESLNDYSPNSSDVEDLNSLKAEVCEDKCNEIKNTNL